MCVPLTRSDYYGTSAPPDGHQSATNVAHHRTGCPMTGDRGRFPRSPALDRSGRRPALPRQHRHGYAADLHRGLPTELAPGFGVDRRHPSDNGHALHPGPDPPGSSRHNPYGASTTGSLALHLLISLDGPAPSGSSGTSRRCRGRLPPSPAFPGSGCPQLHQAAATAQRSGSLTPTRLTGASWRTPL
jgi:hypothetical protein